MIVVTTPTGQIGHRVVDQLLTAGEPVRVVVRDPDRLDPSVRDRVQVVVGSHGDSGTAARAFEGADSVLHVVPPDPSSADIAAHYRRFAEATAAAVRATGVARIVAVTTLGRGWVGAAGLLSAALDAEPAIEATGVAYRALAMPFFMDNLLNQTDALATQGSFFLANSADRELLTVATSDVADVAVPLLRDPEWTGQERLAVVGPDRSTPAQMAEVLAEVLARPIRFVQVPPDAYRESMEGYGLGPAWSAGLTDMAVAQNDGIYDQPSTARRAPTPTSFHDWCREVLAPALKSRSATA